MRLLTFSFLKNCKFKKIPIHVYSQQKWAASRGFSEFVRREVEEDDIKGDESLVEVGEGWGGGEGEAGLLSAALRGMRVVPEFISAREEDALMQELEPVLRRMRYEFDHWDNAIHGYRETERAAWRPENEAVFERVRRLAFSAPSLSHPRAPRPLPLPHVHVLDLAPAGHIKPHVDAVRFCGEVIAGLCLLSPAVMVLQHEQHKHLTLRALLPRRGLYVMRGVSRYEFSHAVAGGAQSVWRGERLQRTRRVALICRAQPPPPPPPPAPGDDA